MSASHSPPRKRVRSHKESSSSSSAMNNQSSSSNSENNVIHPSPDLMTRSKTSSSNEMKLNNNVVNDGVSVAAAAATSGSASSSSDDNEILEEVMDATKAKALIHKIPRRSSLLSKTDQEVVRIIGQHLTNIGLKTSADVLMQEAGCRLDQPTAATFRKLVMSGQWTEAVKTLEDLKSHLENPESLVEMKFLLLEQKYLEYLSSGNSIEALKVLQTELSPLRHNRNRTHELSSYLMLSNPEDLARVTTTCRPSTRPELMDRLQAYLPASIMLPPRRLKTLLMQAAEYQIDRCLYHNRPSSSPTTELDLSCLPTDHQCSKKEFPSETIQILTEHCDEVWYCRFSPDGLKLATGSKDNTVIIWDFDPVTLKLKQNKTLEGHTNGVSYFAWSPDSTRLAVCGPEESEEVHIWNVNTGKCDGKITHQSEDSLTTVSWSPDGNKITCGGSRGQFYQCDTKGQVLDSWEGVRVQCLAFRANGKSILAADTHHRIRSYNFEELTDKTVLQEDHGIMSFSLDAYDRHALLNIATQGIHMWDIEERCLVRKFVGITQGFYTIYSCFGGVDQSFVASGSEDTKVYIYHIKRSTPIAVLSGHTRTVTAVTWNPVYPQVLVSASDDNTLRVWGPSEKYRKQQQTTTTTTAVAASTTNGVTNGASSSSFGNSRNPSPNSDSARYSGSVGLCTSVGGGGGSGSGSGSAEGGDTLHSSNGSDTFQ